MTTLSSREFNQDTSRAKKAAAAGPVIITDRGKPSHVLLNIEDYRRLAEPSKSLAEILSCDDDIDLDAFLPPRNLPPRNMDLT